MEVLEKNEAICRVQKPLSYSAEKLGLFVAACREMAIFHSRQCPEISYLYRKQGFQPDSVQTEEDLARIPSINVHAMKYYLLLSRSPEHAVLKLTSSGTKGQKTQIWFDVESLERCQAMLASLWEEEGLLSDVPTNYLMFSYDPADAKDLGTAFSARNRQRFAPVKKSFFCIRKDNQGRWKFERKLAMEKLRSFAMQSAPVRLMGNPAFIHEFMLEVERTEPARLPPRSYIFTSGGWKAAEDKRIPKEEFREMASRLLGISEKNVRDGYGMAEHSAPYWECEAHRLHVPVYARLLVRDPRSLAPVPDGEAGLLELLTPFNAMMPTLALLSTDMAVVEAEKCPCGKTSPTFRILGRGGLKKHKGCAIQAAEIIKRGSR